MVTHTSTTARTSPMPSNAATPSWPSPCDVRDMRRAAIIIAAAAVFGEHGLDGASMRMIAQRAGCTTGAIYPLFASKEDLYAELLNTSLAQLYTHVASAAARRGKGLAHERAALAFLDYYLARPNEVNLGLYAFQGLKARGVGKQHDRDLNQALARTLALLSPANARTDGADIDICSMAVFAQLIGTLVLHQAGRLRVARFSPRQLIEHALAHQHLPDRQLPSPHPRRHKP